MKTVRVTEPSVLEIADAPEPSPADGVVVRTRIVGICGTDVKVYTGKIPVDYPRVMGHEMVGEVVAAPTGGPVSPGDRVLIDPPRRADGVICAVVAEAICASTPG